MKKHVLHSKTMNTWNIIFYFELIKNKQKVAKRILVYIVFSTLIIELAV